MALTWDVVSAGRGVVFEAWEGDWLVECVAKNDVALRSKYTADSPAAMGNYQYHKNPSVY